MAAMIDTLEFADRFEHAGFEHDKARALAAAFALANEAGREDLVTKSYLDARLAQFEARAAETETRLIKAIAENGRELSGRLWSTVAIIAGVSTAISATVGAGVALLIRYWGFR